MAKIIFIEVELLNSKCKAMIPVSKIVEFWKTSVGKCSIFLGGEETITTEGTYEEFVATLSTLNNVEIIKCKK
jgi:hypothetical protein